MLWQKGKGCEVSGDYRLRHNERGYELWYFGVHESIILGRDIPFRELAEGLAVTHTKMKSARR